MHKKQNESGFAVVETVLVIIILALIGVVGWMVYRDDHKSSEDSSRRTASASKPKDTAKPARPVNPYAGWKSYCSDVGGLCFKYPSSWAFKKTTYAPGESAGGVEYDTVTSPSGKVIVKYNPEFGIGCTGNNDTVHVILVKPVLADGLEVVNLIDKSNVASPDSYHIYSFIATAGHTADPYSQGAVLTNSYEPNCHKFKNPNLPNLPGNQMLEVQGVVPPSEVSDIHYNPYPTYASAEAWFNGPEVKAATQILESVSYNK